MQWAQQGDVRPEPLGYYAPRWEKRSFSKLGVPPPMHQAAYGFAAWLVGVVLAFAAGNSGGVYALCAVAMVEATLLLLGSIYFWIIGWRMHVAGVLISSCVWCLIPYGLVVAMCSSIR